MKNLDSEINKELLEKAKEHFRESRYSAAEPILNQLILQNYKPPEIFHMLGTIYYDQGKFNKAIRSFRRALEIDPSFTDASVGLSIILNDLGRYEEGRKIFEEAQVMLKKNSSQDDPYIKEKLALKHDELGELYFQYKMFSEALEQYTRARHLSQRRAELTMKVAECFLRTSEADKAIQELRDLVKEEPQFLNARIKLGQAFYEDGQVPEAIDQWEAVLQLDSHHPEAHRLLRQAQSIEVTMMMPEGRQPQL